MEIDQSRGLQINIGKRIKIREALARIFKYLNDSVDREESMLELVGRDESISKAVTITEICKRKLEGLEGITMKQENSLWREVKQIQEGEANFLASAANKITHAKTSCLKIRLSLCLPQNEQTKSLLRECL